MAQLVVEAGDADWVCGVDLPHLHNNTEPHRAEVKPGSGVAVTEAEITYVDAQHPIEAVRLPLQNLGSGTCRVFALNSITAAEVSVVLQLGPVPLTQTFGPAHQDFDGSW